MGARCVLGSAAVAVDANRRLRGAAGKDPRGDGSRSPGRAGGDGNGSERPVRSPAGCPSSSRALDDESFEGVLPNDAPSIRTTPLGFPQTHLRRCD